MTRAREARGGNGRRQPRAPSRSELRTRQLICFEAARIMAEEGIRDFQHAKRKACERLDMPPGRLLPSNAEIDAALGERLRLFNLDQLGELQQQKLLRAMQTMELLAAFSPRLVGAVLSGNVVADTPVELHVFSAPPEELCLFLHDHSIPFELFDKRYRFGGDRYKTLPGVRFTAAEVALEVTIFPRDRHHEAPLSPVDGRPMQRARLAAVNEMLAAVRADE